MSSVSQSRSFRLITAVVAILLLLALIAVVLLTFRTEYAAIPTATPRPTATPLPTNDKASTLTPDDNALVAQNRLDTAGFAYGLPSDFTENQTENAVTLAGDGSGDALSPIFLLSRGPRTQFVDQEHETLDDAFEHFVDFFAERDNFDVGEVQTISVDGVDARSVDLTSQNLDQFAGRIVMAQPSPDQLFVLTGVAPQAIWLDEASAEYAAVLASVTFFEPEAATPLLIPTQVPTATPSPTATPTSIPPSMAMPTPNPSDVPVDLPALYSNANFLNALTTAGSTLWAATEGGVVAWNRRNDGQLKFTAMDGLDGNHFHTVANCPLPGLGVVFGNRQGLQVFDARSGTWNALNSDNSAMGYDDVSVVRCYPAYDFAVIGYAQNGLDIYDATTNEWQPVGRADGLFDETVQDVAVLGDRDAIWVSSGSGLTVLSSSRPAVYNASNSPLTGDQIGAMTLTADGTLWIGEPGMLHRIQDGQWLAYSANLAAGRFPRGQITGIDDAGSGQVWLVSDAGEVCRFDVAEIECIEFYVNEADMPSPPYTDLTVHSDGSLSVGTSGNGLGHLDGQSWTTRTVDGEFLANNTVLDLVQSRDGFLWIAGKSGLQQLDPNKPVVQRLYTFADDSLPIANVGVLNIDGGSLWIGGDGAARAQGDTWHVYTVEDGLAGETVQAIAVDGQLRTWLGTERGLSIWNGDIFFNLTAANGLPSDDITALQTDGEAMWIGSNGGGLYRFTSNQLRIFDADSADLPSNVVTALGQGEDGELWVGTAEGLARFNEEQAVLVEALPPVPITEITVLPEAKTSIYVGTAGQGAYRYDGSTWHRLADEGPQPSSYVGAILVDTDDTVWLGGQSGGIVRIEGE